MLHSVNDVLAAQFLLDDSQSKVYAARDQFLYYVTKQLTHNDFSLEDENADKFMQRIKRSIGTKTSHCELVYISRIHS